MGTLLRALISTALVLGLMLYIARAARKPGMLSSKLKIGAGPSLVVSRASVNRTTTLAVVRFGGKDHLIAANEASTQLLASTDVEGEAVTTTQPAETALTHAADPQLEALRNTLKPTTFADVLRGYTTRRVVEPQ